jgi:hypothetical protein
MQDSASSKSFEDAVHGLESGDFSRLEPIFSGDSGASPIILQWHEQGLFRDEPEALAEALTCACFLGKTDVAEYFLKQGLAPSGGAATGLDALHWAANRGQLKTVQLLIQYGAPLNTRSMYGGTPAGTAVWSAINEPRADHLRIIEEVLSAGAPFPNEEYPSGHKEIDDVLGHHRKE